MACCEIKVSFGIASNFWFSDKIKGVMLNDAESGEVILG
jgi:hypothetical protein